MIDLHCHSNFSDGMHTPAMLLTKALATGIKVLALTDHDTIAGLSQLHDAACMHQVKVINGIEVSTRWKKHDIHIIGLNIEPQHAVIQALIVKQNENRITRAIQISNQLAGLGVANAYDKACQIAGHERVGRPHFAQVLIAEQLVIDIKTAFKRFLGRGRPAYIPTPWIGMEEAVAAIVNAKGQAVLAHPLKYGLTNTKLHQLIENFKEAGGIGMEVVSGEMTEAEIQQMAGCCLRYQLLASTGSDFHGEGMSRIALGRQPKLPVNCRPIWDLWNI